MKHNDLQTKGIYVPFNNDDDNNNGLPDTAWGGLNNPDAGDPGKVENENDLRPITIDLNGAKVEVGDKFVISYTSYIELYRTKEREGRLGVFDPLNPHAVEIDAKDKLTLFIEGRYCGGNGLHSDDLKIEWTRNGQAITSDTIKVNEFKMSGAHAVADHTQHTYTAEGGSGKWLDPTVKGFNDPNTVAKVTPPNGQVNPDAMTVDWKPNVPYLGKLAYKAEDGSVWDFDHVFVIQVKLEKRTDAAGKVIDDFTPAKDAVQAPLVDPNNPNGDVSLATGPTTDPTKLTNESECEVVTVKVVLKSYKYMVGGVATYGGTGLDVGLIQRAVVDTTNAVYQDGKNPEYTKTTNAVGIAALDQKQPNTPWAGPDALGSSGKQSHATPTVTDYSTTGELAYTFKLVDRPALPIPTIDGTGKLIRATFKATFVTFVAIGYTPPTSVTFVATEKDVYWEKGALVWGINYDGSYDSATSKFTQKAGIKPVTSVINDFLPLKPTDPESKVRVDGKWTSDLDWTWK